MRRSWFSWGGAVLLLLGIALLGGCKQGEGERCQLDSDCDGELKCCVRSNDRATGGVCTLKCELQGDLGFMEAGAAKEAGPTRDSSASDGLKPDRTVLDNGVADQLVPDLLAADQMPPDHAVTPDTKAAFDQGAAASDIQTIH